MSNYCGFFALALALALPVPALSDQWCYVWAEIGGRLILHQYPPFDISGPVLSDPSGRLMIKSIGRCRHGAAIVAQAPVDSSGPAAGGVQPAAAPAAPEDVVAAAQRSLADMAASESLNGKAALYQSRTYLESHKRAVFKAQSAACVAEDKWDAFLNDGPDVMWLMLQQADCVVAERDYPVEILQYRDSMTVQTRLLLNGEPITLWTSPDALGLLE